jgi:hypothetical protein
MTSVIAAKLIPKTLSASFFPNADRLRTPFSMSSLTVVRDGFAKVFSTIVRVSVNGVHHLTSSEKVNAKC